MRICCALLAFVSVAIADDPAPLIAKAEAEVEGGKAAWTKFMSAGADMPDAEIQALAKRYDDAIDLYQKAEAAGAKDTWPPISMLARRTAKLRATLFWREQKRAREAGKKEPAPAPPPAAVKPHPKEDPPAPAAKPGPPAPEIYETRAQRARSIQNARNFVMRHFKWRKKTIMAMSCPTCRATGTIHPIDLDGDGERPAPRACQRCSGFGHLFSVSAVRKAFWFTRTPGTRRNPDAQSWWELREGQWLADPPSAPWLNKLSIKRVDYHGLWADVTWKEWRGRVLTERTRRLIRVGRRWYWFTAGFDDDLLNEAAR